MKTSRWALITIYRFKQQMIGKLAKFGLCVGYLQIPELKKCFLFAIILCFNYDNWGHILTINLRVDHTRVGHRVGNEEMFAARSSFRFFSARESPAYRLVHLPAPWKTARDGWKFVRRKAVSFWMKSGSWTPSSRWNCSGWSRHAHFNPWDQQSPLTSKARL